MFPKIVFMTQGSARSAPTTGSNENGGEIPPLRALDFLTDYVPSVTQYETTCVSAGGASLRMILSVSLSPDMQFIGSGTIAQHGLFVDESGVPALLHAGSTFSL